MGIGAWFILALLAAIGAYEVWAWRAQRDQRAGLRASAPETITDVLRDVNRRVPWFKWLFGAGLAVLWIHLYWGR